MEVSEAPIDTIATLNETESSAPVNSFESAAPAEPVADNNVTQFKKDVRKKEIQLDDVEFTNAKSYLSTKINSDSLSVYDHLTSLVSRLLETKPTNALDSFESLSAQIKKTRFKADLAESAYSLKTVADNSADVELSKTRLQLFNFKKLDSSEPGEIPDIIDLANLWEWAGVSFGKEDTFVLLNSIKKLVNDKHIKSVRLWGKIFGSKSNYIIVETELKEGAADEDDQIVNPPAVEASVPEGELAADDPEKDAPKPKSKPTKKLTVEKQSGVNKYIYYVCSYAGGQWTRLPDVIPEKLQLSRQINKMFTGDLKNQIRSYPVFGGDEAQYLRCQIARISAATVISPSGYYIPDPEEAESEAGNNPTIIINAEYEGLSNEQLLLTSNWVHHVPYILPQGRINWENPLVTKNEEEGEGEEEEEEEVKAEPETGPAMLSAINLDDELGNLPSWSSRLCSSLSPANFSPVVLKSNRWIGATVVSYNDKFTNIYMGNGLKNLGNPTPTFAPPLLPPVQSEFVAPEGTTPLEEQLDPTVEAEAALEAERKSKEESKAEEEGEEEED